MTRQRIDYPTLFPHVVEGYIAGKSQMAIATELNTHPSHVSRALHVHGLSHYKLVKLVGDGLTAEQIIKYATAKEPQLPLTESGSRANANWQTETGQKVSSLVYPESPGEALTAKEPEFPMLLQVTDAHRSGDTVSLTISHEEQELSALHRKVSEQSQVILQQARIIEAMQAFNNTVQEAYVTLNRTLAERQKADAAPTRSLEVKFNGGVLEIDGGVSGGTVTFAGAA